MAEINVPDHFHKIRSEIEGVIKFINHEGARAFKDGNYSRAKELTDMGSELEKMKISINSLIRKWLDIRVIEKKTPKRRKSRRIEKIQHGLRTHENKFRIPILQTLVEMGDSGPVKTVIDGVGVIMKGTLNDYDYMPLVSNPRTPRWRNTAMWARHRMLTEGLIANNSPVGIWEITPEGKQWLLPQRK